MAGRYTYFKALAGNTYILRFTTSTFYENKPTEEHPDWSMNWVYTVDVWQSPEDYKAEAKAKTYYWRTYESLHPLLQEIGIEKNTVISLKPMQEINEQTDKTYNIYEVTDSHGRVYSTSKRNQTAKPAEGGEDFDERNPPPLGEENPQSLPAQPLDVPDNEQVIFDRMERCVDHAMIIGELAKVKEGTEFSPEDIEKIAVSMFMAINGR